MAETYGEAGGGTRPGQRPLPERRRQPSPADGDGPDRPADGPAPGHAPPGRPPRERADPEQPPPERSSGDRAAPPPERRAELDALRALVVIGLVFFHSGLVFARDDDFYVKNSETSDAVLIVAGLGVVWAMPLLFLIAGVGSRHSLRGRGAAGFARERLRRLGVPLLFATLVLLPLPQWLRLRSSGPGPHPSYPEFLPRFFDVRLEPAEFPFVLQGEHFETGHLWFVVLLLVFSLLLAPLAARRPGRRGTREGGAGGGPGPGPAARVSARAAAAVGRRGVVLLPAVPFALVCAGLGLEEGYGGWHRWAYLLFFALGLVLAGDARFRAAVRRDALPAAALALLLFALAAPGFTADGDPFTDRTPAAVAARALFGATGWCAVVAILGLPAHSGSSSAVMTACVTSSEHSVGPYALT
ncbi:acyltransferase family protein, partial [Streptomyces sp. NPDC048845]|uniref:acyltransferase family protein n=1 Tax=Streptomyces sp. NPDC048845 TaxID=3155390 RepID=UPI00343686F0